MAEAKICDICKKPIKSQSNLLFGSSIYSQYVVKIKRIEEGFSIAGGFRKTQVLDVCPQCMEKFIEFAREEVE